MENKTKERKNKKKGTKNVIQSELKPTCPFTISIQTRPIITISSNTVLPSKSISMYHKKTSMYHKSISM
jgi:hypothetical protein